MELIHSKSMRVIFAYFQPLFKGNNLLHNGPLECYVPQGGVRISVMKMYGY